MSSQGVLQALHLPGDATANPVDVEMSLAAGARQLGVRVEERQRVQSIVVDRGAVRGVVMQGGHHIETNCVVNCAGQWARQVGRMAGVSVPLYSAQHFYVISEACGVPLELPIIRDPDNQLYAREWSSGLCVGAFERNAKAAFEERGGEPPEHFEFALLAEDWDHFEPVLEAALARFPGLGSAGVKMTNGPESFTPDNAYILGEAPEVRGFFVCAGMNSSGIASAAGAGHALAQWIRRGEPPGDLWATDIRRFSPGHHCNTAFLRERTKESLGAHYAVRYPREEMQSGRGLRRSPLYATLARKGAQFGSKFAWERALYFGGAAPPTFGAPEWLPDVSREHMALRTSCGISDVSSFAKLSVKGFDAASFLNRVCAGQILVERRNPIVYTPLLNSRGGIETDLTVHRLAQNEYLAVTSTAQETRDMHWMRRQVLPWEDVRVEAVSSATGVLSLMGPLAPAVMARATRSPMDFPYASWRSVDLGMTTCRAARVSYVGEQGWEIYAPIECLQQVYEHLWSAGQPQGITDVGYYAIESARVEKGMRAFAHELTPDVTPYEAGLAFTLDMNKGDFVGREALLATQTPPANRLVCFKLADGSVYGHGDEPILLDSRVVGFSTSVAHAASSSACVGMGYVRKPSGDPWKSTQGRWQIEIFGTPHQLSYVGLKPPVI